MHYDFISEGQEWDEAESVAITDNIPEKFSIVPLQILSSSRLNSTEKAVYAAIVSHLRGKKTQCFPSFNRIADLVGISRRTAIRAVKILVEENFLKKNQQYRVDGGYTSNSYTLVTNMTLSSDNNDTSPSDTVDTTPSVRNVTTNNRRKNNNNFSKKNKNTRERVKNAPAENQMAAGQTDLEDFVTNPQDREIFNIIKNSANKAAAWVEFIRESQNYFLRPISPQADQYYSIADFNQLLQLVKNKAGSCQALKFGQRLTKEIIINGR